MRDLTPRQQEVFRFIREYSSQNACPPTLREIAAFFDISLRAVQEHLAALERKGVILHGGKRSRGIKILKNAAEESEVSEQGERAIPILGTVAAGKPIMSEENYCGEVRMAASRLKNGRTYFALRVRGESMIGAGILDGDIAVIEQRNVAENGQIVVAILDEAITLKRFYREPGRIRLKSENPTIGDRWTTGDIGIAGILIQVIREY
ncbi:MAG: transcriptional repressor LexA [Spirochaetaceae bacterium]|jgi:repressor LexA|nr:transcriptional repressor LexA [Spirochaetaceae bacterium]